MGALVRDTRGAGPVGNGGYNRFPPSPLCSITWFFEGQSEIVNAPANGASCPRSALLPRLAFSGPQRRPTVTRNPAGVHAMMLVLYPDAMSALSGLDVSAYVDRTVAADEVLDDRWQALCAEVFQAQDDARRFALIESRLSSWWQAARTGAVQGGRRLQDWLGAFALRAAAFGAGRSPRQLERRMKAWTGQTLREMRVLARLESLYFHALSGGAGSGGHDWADLASAAGFADQSHMVRHARRATGFPAAQLWQRIEQDPQFWPYRALAALADE